MNDNTPKERSLKILIRILQRPYAYTKKDLAKHFGLSTDAISDYITAFKNVGIEPDFDERFRYAIIPGEGFKELNKLRSLTDSEKASISRALDKISIDKQSIMNKLDSLYDFQKLGLRTLRKPELRKIDLLQQSKEEKKQVKLVNYHSNSNDVKDRTVECIHIDTEGGMVQVFDPEKKDVRHFKLRRIERVEILDEPWANEKRHFIKYTDVFRIADNNKVRVHLILDVFSYNYLIDLFPQSKAHIQPGVEEHTYDFEGEVNHQFLGLIPFIMSNAGHVKIGYPNELIEVVKKKANQILQEIQ